MLRMLKANQFVLFFVYMFDPSEKRGDFESWVGLSKTEVWALSSVPFSSVCIKLNQHNKFGYFSNFITLFYRLPAAASNANISCGTNKKNILPLTNNMIYL